MSHSPEPWSHTPYSGPAPNFQMFCIRDNNSTFLCGVAGEDPQQSLDNINRIIACVNACSGIPTEQLLNYSVFRNLQTQFLAELTNPLVSLNPGPSNDLVS